MGPNRPDTGFIWTDLAGDGQVHATGSQTEVGSSENAISYQLKPGAENNYNIIGEHVRHPYGDGSVHHARSAEPGFL